MGKLLNQNLRFNQRSTIVALAGVASLLCIGWVAWPNRPDKGQLSSAVLDVPIVMHTNGGRLEVAIVTATEGLKLDAPQKSLLGIDLGNTFSHVQVKVVYRYYIDMAKEWRIKIQGNTAIIEVGELKASLPVAFDTGSMQKQTVSGWARFDKGENLAELEKQMTQELGRRAGGYLMLALPSARMTVADFSKTWLTKNKYWGAFNIAEVKVIFPGDLVRAID